MAALVTGRPTRVRNKSWYPGNSWMGVRETCAGGIGLWAGVGDRVGRGVGEGVFLSNETSTTF